MYSQDKLTLIYVGDPMCSWCYGFSPELSEALSELEGQIDFEMVMGGLRPYNTETMADLKDFLTHHWETVEKSSGQKFQFDILDRADFVYDTEPPSRAVLVVRSIDPKKEFDFFKAVQKAFYFDNLDTHNVSTYLPILKALEIDSASFQEKFESEAFKKAIKEDFAFAEKLGARSFPSLIAKKGEEYFLVGSGYMKSDQVLKQIDRLSK